MTDPQPSETTTKKRSKWLLLFVIAPVISSCAGTTSTRLPAEVLPAYSVAIIPVYQEETFISLARTHDPPYVLEDVHIRNVDEPLQSLADHLPEKRAVSIPLLPFGVLVLPSSKGYRMVLALTQDRLTVITMGSWEKIEIELKGQARQDFLDFIDSDRIDYHPYYAKNKPLASIFPPMARVRNRLTTAEREQVKAILENATAPND